MLEMTSNEITRQIRLRESVEVPAKIDSKKAHFTIKLHELTACRTTIDGAIKCIHEKIVEIENGEAKFAKKFSWDKKEKAFKAAK